MKKAILYIGVSTDEQSEKGFSIPDQEDRLTRYCERNNIEIIAKYFEDYSGKRLTARSSIN